MHLLVSILYPREIGKRGEVDCTVSLLESYQRKYSTDFPLSLLAASAHPSVLDYLETLCRQFKVPHHMVLVPFTPEPCMNYVRDHEVAFGKGILAANAASLDYDFLCYLDADVSIELVDLLDAVRTIAHSDQFVRFPVPARKGTEGRDCSMSAHIHSKSLLLRSCYHRRIYRPRKDNGRLYRGTPPDTAIRKALLRTGAQELVAVGVTTDRFISPHSYRRMRGGSISEYRRLEHVIGYDPEIAPMAISPNLCQLIYAKCRELGATTVLDLGTGIGNAWRAALYGGTARVTTVDHDKTFTALAQSAGIPSEQLCTLHAQIAPCEGLGPYNLTSISDEPFDLAIVDGPDDDNRAKILSARQVKSRSFIFCNITQDDTSLEEFIAISRSACREIRVERLEIDRGVCILSFPGRLHSIPSVIWDEESRMLRTITSISSQKKDDMAPAPPTNPYYPCYVWTDASRSTIHNIRRFGCRHIAEVGILHGATTVLIARFLHSLGEDTSLHIFDFEERVQEVDGQIRRIGYPYLTSHATSHKLMDSYNWALMQLIKSGDHPIFDYIFLDGAHTWQVDALAFFLLDKLLKVGGYIEFDDYHWSIAKSPTMNPEAFPMSAEMYTEEQIQASHVGLIIDLLVRTNKRYKEIETNRTFQKLYNC